MTLFPKHQVVKSNSSGKEWDSRESQESVEEQLEGGMHMGAGGEAPPVKSEDVLILVGASILLVMLIIQTWTIPTQIAEGDGNEFTVKYDLSEGDTFSIKVLEGEVRPTVVLPSGEKQYSQNNVDDNWEFKVKDDGVHSFQILGLEDSEIEYDLSRGIFFDFIMYPIGIAFLSFGIWKRRSEKNYEPLEALLED